MNHPTTLSLLSVLALVACATGDAVLETQEVDDMADRDASARAPTGPGAALSPLRVGLPELTLEVARRVELVREGGRARWRASGRSSAELRELHSWVPDDAFGRAELTGPHTFSLFIEEPSEQSTALSGLPVFLQLRTASGAQLAAALWLRPQLEPVPASGADARLRFGLVVTPVWVAGDASYRGRLTAPRGAALELSGAPAPGALDVGDGRWQLDWTFDAYAAALAADPARVAARAAAPGGDRFERSAELSVRVGRLGLTQLDPRQVWAQTCEPRVRACLAALPVGQLDAGACGSYRQVLACGGPAGARAER